MLTDIYLCVSGRMKTLVYEYCLSALFEQRVLVVVDKKVRVNTVRRRKGSHSRRKARRRNLSAVHTRYGCIVAEGLSCDDQFMDIQPTAAVARGGDR